MIFPESVDSGESYTGFVPRVAAKPGQLEETEPAPTPAPAAGGRGAGRKGPVKAKDAPGVTAGGQATDRFGNKTAPSGSPQINKTRSNTREGARNKALNQGSKAEEHRTPKRGRRHFHPRRANGKKTRDNPHHEF
jgi:hypothetical protein